MLNPVPCFRARTGCGAPPAVIDAQPRSARNPGRSGSPATTQPRNPARRRFMRQSTAPGIGQSGGGRVLPRCAARPETCAHSAPLPHWPGISTSRRPVLQESPDPTARAPSRKRTPSNPSNNRPTRAPVLDGPEAGIGLGIHDREDLLIRSDVEQQRSCSFSDPLHELTGELRTSTRVFRTALDDRARRGHNQPSVPGHRSAFLEDRPELILAQSRPGLFHDLTQNDPPAPGELQVVAVTGRRLMTDPLLSGQDEPTILPFPRPSPVDDIGEDRQGQV